MIIIGATTVAEILSADAASMILYSIKIVSMVEKFYAVAHKNVSIAFVAEAGITIYEHCNILRNKIFELVLNTFVTPNVRELYMFQ